MVNKSFPERSRVFATAVVFGLVMCFFWWYAGEAWGSRGDTRHYLDLYNGEVARTPFGFRILTPWLAHLFPGSYESGFRIVTFTSLALIAGIMVLLVNAQNISRFKVLTVAVLWTTTFAFVYNTTTQVRADSVMLLLMAAAYWASVNRVSYVVLCIIMVAGVLAHEIILIFIPALWLDKVFKANGTGGNLYPAWQLAAVTVVAVVAYVVSRKVIPVLPATEVNYWSDPLKIVSHALQYSGGVVKHLLRIYAAYGPVLVYAFFFVATQPGPKILASLGLFLLAVGATFLATDTLRVMTVMFVPLLVLATDYIGRIHQTQSRFLAWSLILLQVLYTYVVFGHLRTFEHSDMLNIVAGILSIAAFIMCVYLAYKTNLSTRLMKSRSS